MASRSPLRPRPVSGRITGSTSSTPRARGLHRRGGALPARARRRGRRVRRRRRRRAPVGDGVAPGRPLQGAADRVRQQDGPRRRRLRPLRLDDALASLGLAGADPDPLGQGGPARGRDRPARHARHPLQERDARRPVRGDRHPGRPPGGGHEGARADGRGGRRDRRRAAREVPLGRRGHRGRDPRRPAPRDGHQPAPAGALRQRLQEQGRPAAARRGGRLPAVAGRPAAGRGADRGRGGAAQARGRRTTRRSRP